MSFVSVLLCADPCLGRIDKSSLSQQTLMELLIADLSHTYSIRDSSDDLIDKWKGVSLSDSDAVTSIDWHAFALKGKFLFEWLPETVEDLIICTNNLNGQIPMQSLPQGLHKWRFRRNSFCGSLDLDALPPNIVEVLATSNKLTGTISLENLPDSLKKLFLGLNDFHGTVCLTKLPGSMTILALNICSFTGTVNLTKLPPNMERLYLDRNSFEGETDFRHLPKTLIIFNIGNNRGLSGEIFETDRQFFSIENTKIVFREG
mmetsp:Transcript_1912/g.2937  ORF Transcript_1912/g.2937 Transcript_1912/m.2937 type:complete len:260 (+) Transcript_1912:26-805(+)